MGVAVNAELPILVLAAGIACALIAWLLAYLHPDFSRLSIPASRSGDRVPPVRAHGIDLHHQRRQLLRRLARRQTGLRPLCAGLRRLPVSSAS